MGHNLPDKWNKEDLTSLFEKFGEIGDVFIPRDRDTGRDRPFGFLRFYKEADAEDAIKELDGTRLGGVEITVAKAQKSRSEAFQAQKAAEQFHQNRRSDGGGRNRGRSDSRRTRRRSPSRRKQRHDS